MNPSGRCLVWWLYFRNFNSFTSVGQYTYICAYIFNSVDYQIFNCPMLRKMFAVVSSTWSIDSQPPQCHCYLPPTLPDCWAKADKLIQENMKLDIDDVTDSVMKVMRICGLRPWEVKRSEEVIRRSLTHYEEVRERIDRVPRKRFSKETFLHGLASEAQMNRMDAQMAYAIIKRAFKALYYGTGQDGKRYLALQEFLMHSQECLWLHAARRTAEIHAVLNGMMHSEEQQFEERIECVYKNLFDVLQTRVVFADNWVCNCDPAPEGKSVSNAVSTMTAQMEVLFHKQNLELSTGASAMTYQRLETNRTAGSEDSRYNYFLKRANNKTDQKQPDISGDGSDLSQTKCNCPHLRCFREEGETREAPEITAECSQGPYICRWLPFTEEDDTFDEHCAPFPPLEEVCPPCDQKELSCDAECTCTCQVCKCRPFYEGDDDIGEEENLGEKQSKSGVEDYDTDYCWLAPFRGSSKERLDRKKMAVQPEEVPVKEEAAEEKDALSKCCCMCKYKRDFPHLFTYLAPFKEEPERQPQAQPSKPEPIKTQLPLFSESEDLLSKPPPRGVSLAGYRCWVKSKPSTSSESQEERDPLVMVCSQEQKVKGGSKGPEIIVTTKTQHHPSPDSAGNAAPAKPTANPPAKVAPNPTPSKSNKPAPAPAKPPVAPKQPDQPQEEDKLTKEDILDIIGLRFK
ncbi:uncharacterized protein Dana_GF13160, isoform A [Drosophila ananassae]|uniref:Uncharacterized protein, isoform A n=1 Tax=Drosophila ananassae TaxID=7217 RepID=B3MH70_DROAN|nr:uncharacterized protein LOC6496003 isoform X2 [Drosophila ananassae]EDV36847.2 uncharacterized protein Dana_GF13160, isoform A [Drosophila ananassae]